MPYVTVAVRSELDGGRRPANAGELNYAITRLVDRYLIDLGGMRYAHLNEAIGALECAKLELYRRLAGPYEDRKLAETGEVYQVLRGPA